MTVTPEMIEAGLADLRDRKLLKYLFAAEDGPCGAYGYVSEPLELETQREVVAAIYLAMREKDETYTGLVEAARKALTILIESHAWGAAVTIEMLEAALTKAQEQSRG